ncbi:MAG: class I SAM-dependent methyltransferase [Alicyclobacillus sp.]|nr:class I SAM-dependent methyltransferase [Alicyclobacillus sp.]
MYERFAQVYDRFMNDGPYEPWLDWFRSKGAMARQWTVADVACGTGRLTVPLAALCRRVYGVDQSADMLAEAAARAMDARARIVWLAQDMRNLVLPEQVDVVCCTCDSLNYLLSPADVQTFLHAVWAALRPGGWFCFDALGPGRIAALSDGLWYDIQPDAAVLFSTVRVYV